MIARLKWHLHPPSPLQPKTKKKGKKNVVKVGPPLTILFRSAHGSDRQIYTYLDNHVFFNELSSFPNIGCAFNSVYPKFEKVIY